LPDGQHVRFGQRWVVGQHLLVPASHSCSDPQQLMLPPLPQTVPEQQAPPRQLSVELGQQFPLHCLPLAQPPARADRDASAGSAASSALAASAASAALLLVVVVEPGDYRASP
jgi:hypothetical protein